MPIIDTTGIRPIERRQPTEGLDRVRRRDEGGGGFRPQTNVNLKAAIQDIAATLGKIASEEKTGLQRLPKEVGDVVKNILQQALSMESTLGKGIGSTIESQRFSMDQLILFSRLLTQMGSLSDRGYSMRLSDDTQTLMTQFKAALVAQEGGESLEPVLVSKAAFELVDAKVAEQLPPVLYEILSQLAQVSINAPQQQESPSDSMQFLKQLVKFFMPRPGVDVPIEDESQQQMHNQQRGQTSSSFLNSLFRSFGGRANAPQGQPAPFNQSQAPQGQPAPFNQSNAPQGQATPFNQSQAPQGQATAFNQSQAPQGQATPFNQSQAPQGQATPFNQSQAPQGQATAFNQSQAPQGQPTPFNQSQAPQGQPTPFNQSQAPQGQPTPFNQSQAPQGQPTPFNQSQSPQGQPAPFNQSQAPQGQATPFNQSQAPQGQPAPFNQSQAPQGQPTPFNQSQAPQGQATAFNQSQAPQGQATQFNQSQAPQGQPTQFNQSQAPQGQATPFNQSQAPQGQAAPFNQSNAPQGQATPFNQSQAPQGQAAPFNQSNALQGQATQFNQSQAPQGQAAQFNQSQAPQGQPAPFNQSNAPQGQATPFNQSNAPQGQPAPFNQSNAPQGQPAPFNQSQAPQGQPAPFNQSQAPQGQPASFNQSNAPQGQATAFNQSQAPQGQATPFNQSQAPQGQATAFNQSNAPQGQPAPFNQSQAPQGQLAPFNQSQAPQGQPAPFNQSNAPQGQPTPFNQSQAPQAQPNQQTTTDPFTQMLNETEQEPLDKDFVTRQKEIRHEMKLAKAEMIKQNILNTPETTDTMKNLAQFLLRNQQMTPRDVALLQNFVNNSQSTMSELEARHLQNLLRLCQQNVPLTVQQAAVQQKLPDLPRLWAFMQMCDLASIAANVNPKSYKRIGKDIAEFANSMRRAMSAENSIVQNQRSFQMMMPLYMGDEKISYPTYLSIYDENSRDEDTGEDKKETWLRICVLTDYIGAAELVFRIYDETKLDMRFYFSRQDVAEEFRTIYLDDLRDSINKTPLNVGEVRVGGGFERMFSF